MILQTWALYPGMTVAMGSKEKEKECEAERKERE
jgi:hypothetical protein